ncbi:MAG: hypothetical protein CMJ83_22415 [Planctomycetes bacterium]|nr:hypothetical protein [Planctomycetota bacterium]
MRTRTRAAAWALVAVTSLGVITLPGCGGGTNGGGSNELPNFLSVAGSVFFGFRVGGQETLQQFPTVPVTGIPIPPGAGAMGQTVPPAAFAVGAVGQQDFLLLSFNIPLDAGTIFPTAGSAQDGIVIFANTVVNGTTQSNPVQFALDSTGVVEPGNTFPNTGVAPAVLRLYYDTDNNLQTPETLPQGHYSLQINQTLRGFNGGQFCVNGTGSNCQSQTAFLPEFPFAVGGETNALSMKGGPAGIGASNITQGDTSVPLNSEIHLNFSKAVAFETLVGAANLTTLDPFVTIPIPLAGGVCSTGAPQFGVDVGNLYVGYTAPTDPMSGMAESIPLGLGVIVYMPDPILNPTHVRVRFVDATATAAGQVPGATVALNGVDDPTGLNTGVTQYQNYASNPGKLPIPSSNPAVNAALLQLPAIRVVTGSLPDYNVAMGFTDMRAAIVDVVVASSTFTDPTGLGCSVPPMDLAGRNGNAFVFNQTLPDYYLRFVWAPGATLARNPHPCDAIFVGSQVGNLRGLGVVNVAETMSNLLGPGTNSTVPPWAGSQPIGTVRVQPTRLADSSTLGVPVDIEVGHWVLTQLVQFPSANNSVANPGRLPVNVPGTPDTQEGTTPDGLLGILGVAMPPFPPVQPWGNFLYVIDGDQNAVKVFNGYDFSLITSLAGVGGSPGGLGITPNLEFLYISNFLAGTVTRVFANPVGPLFHTVANIIPLTGSGPTAISVQPSNEDVFVCNFGDNSFSLIDANLSQEQMRFADPGAVGPTEVLITNRMLGAGLTNAYMAFVLNAFSDTVTVYESDSPTVPENGLMGIIKATESGFAGPRRGCWNWQTYIGLTVEPGCYIANTTGTRVDEFTLQNFTLGPPPGFPGPPGTRIFRIQKTYPSGGPLAGGPLMNASPTDVSIDTFSGLYNVLAIGPSNVKGLCDPAAGLGSPTFVIVAYASLGQVGVWDYQQPILRSTASVPGCDFLQSYYDQ